MCHRFQEITWHRTFFNSHTRKMKKTLDKKENVSAIFMDLSKAFDTTNHGLLLAKLKEYCFSKRSLSFMCSYLKNRRQRGQISNTFSSLKEVFFFSIAVQKYGCNSYTTRGGSRAAATSKVECFVINYYHKALHLGCCSSPRSASDYRSTEFARAGDPYRCQCKIDLPPMHRTIVYLLSQLPSFYYILLTFLL